MNSLIGKLKYIVDSYNREFWIFVASVIVLFIAIVFVNNYSNYPSNLVLKDTLVKAERANEYILELEKNFDINSSMLQKTFDFEYTKSNGDITLENFEKYANINLESLVSTNKLITGYFYKLNKDQSSASEVYFSNEAGKLQPSSTIAGSDSSLILDNFEAELKINNAQSWHSITNISSNGAEKPSMLVTYATPLFIDNKYFGYSGIILSNDVLKQVIYEENYTDYNYTFLIDNDGNFVNHPHYAGGENFRNVDNNKFKGLVDSIFSEIKNGKSTGIVEYIKNNRTWIYAYYQMPSGHIFIEAQQREKKMERANLMIFLVAVSSIFCVWLIQDNRKKGSTAFDSFANKLIRNYKSELDSFDESRIKSNVALVFGMACALCVYMVFNIVSSFNYIVFSLYVVTLTIVLFALFRFVARKKIVHIDYILTVLIILVPILLNISFGSFASGGTGEIIIWMAVSVLFALFTFGSNIAKKIFNVFVIALFIEVLLEVYLFNNNMSDSIYTFITSFFFFVFAVFASIDLYVTRSNNSYVEMEKVLKQLQDAQSQLIQKEKMVTLGQLIAGVAHEINTPLGAVKASAETISSSFESLIRSLVLESKSFSEDDFDNLFKVVYLSIESINEMKSTSEIRRAKVKLKEFFAEQQIENHLEVVEKLVRLEICDFDRIQQNLDMIKQSNILDILKVACVLSPLVTGTQTILVATGKVSKIVFALKSYAHYSVSDEPEMFDCVKNIETILVLYHNQIKSSIDVERFYDEDIPPIFGNPDEISQVWTNIIHNAIYAMDGSGKITISIKNNDNRFLDVSISDTGAGISETDLNKIFNIFYTTKPLGEGSGLGLDIVKKIITKHKGNISVRSVVGSGTVFTVSLPIGNDERFKEEANA